MSSNVVGYKINAQKSLVFLYTDNEKIRKKLSRVQLSVTPWTVVHQASLSVGFSRREYWSGLPFPPSGDLPDPGIKSGSPALQPDSLLSEPPAKPKTPSLDPK